MGEEVTGEEEMGDVTGKEGTRRDGCEVGGRRGLR
jgi:hypothetical protein